MAMAMAADGAAARALRQDGAAAAAETTSADTPFGVGSGIIALAVIAAMCALACLLGTRTTRSGVITSASMAVFAIAFVVVIQVRPGIASPRPADRTRDLPRSRAGARAGMASPRGGGVRLLASASCARVRPRPRARVAVAPLVAWCACS